MVKLDELNNMQLSTSDNSRVIFKCNCLDGHGCDQSIELENVDGEYWLHVVSYPTTLLGCLRWWWRHRKVWMSDLQLTKDDLSRLIEVIGMI